MKLSLYFDGSYKVENDIMAWGFIIKDLSTNRTIHKDFGIFRESKSTSNVAEYKALYEGLLCAKKYNPSILYIYGDCRTIIDFHCGTKKPPKKKHLTNYYLLVIKELSCLNEYKIKWISRKQNREADRLLRN